MTPSAPESPPASVTPTVRVPPTPSRTPAEDLGIEFAFEPPGSPCVPASALGAFPLVEDHPYALINAELFDKRDRDPPGGLVERCTYQRAELGGDEEALILEEHGQIVSQTTLFREWEHSSWAGVYPALPVTSDDLDAWALAIVYSNDRGVWREGCGRPPAPCADGEDATVEIHAWQTAFDGHVGNLEFDVDVIYFAENLPPDAAERNVEIFRDYVLAVVESKERVE